MDDAIMNPLEMAVARLPGGNSPVLRTLWGASVGLALTWGLKPGVMFDERGEPRPWAFSSDSHESTLLPWWLGAALPAIALGVFI